MSNPSDLATEPRAAALPPLGSPVRVDAQPQDEPQPPGHDDDDADKGYDDPDAPPADRKPPPSPDENPAVPQPTPRKLETGDETDNQDRGAKSHSAEPASAGVHDRAEPRILALMNQKGGVGKTTSAVNIGAALARAGHRVLLIDLDPQSHLTLSLGIEPETLERSVYHVLVERDFAADDALIELGENLTVLPAELNLAGAEPEMGQLVAVGLAQVQLRNKLKPVLPRYDYVLLDCPPSLGLLTINALALAGEVVVPMQAHFLALQGLSKLLETVAMVGEGINPALEVSGIVLCMHEANTILAGEVVGDVERFLDQGRDAGAAWSSAVVYRPPVRRNIKLAEAPSFGQSIFDYAPGSHGAEDYAAVADAIANQRVTA